MIRNTGIKSCLLVCVFTFWANTAIAVDTPSEPRGTEVGQSLVKWEWDRVSSAELYEVVIDGTEVFTTSDPQYFSFNLWAGEHSLTVRAKNWNGEYSARTPTVKINVSDWFSAASYNRSYIAGEESTSLVSSSAPAPIQEGQLLSKPTDVRGSVTDVGTILWQWTSVPGANTYDVTVDGGYAGTTSVTEFTSSGLWEGDHSMTVVAIAADGDTSERSMTAKSWVGAGVQSDSVVLNSQTSSVVAPPSPVGDTDAANVQSMIDPASYGYNEVYNRSGYDLVFSDEFNGTALNPYRWNTGHRWDGEFNGERFEYRVINSEKQFYVNIFSDDEEHIRDIASVYNPFELSGSSLAIRAIKNPLKTNNNNSAYGSMAEISSQQDFLSGSIATHDKFSQKYGYFEARIKIPSHIGTFPAFWLFHENSVAEGTQKTEIDIMENLGHAPHYVYNTFHYYKDVSPSYAGTYNFIKPNPDGQIFTGIDYSQDFHVYAVEWQPGRIVWLIDGEQVSEVTSSEVDFEELYIKLNLAMGGNWTNFPTNLGGLGRSSGQYFPTQDDLNNFNNPALEIDYIRVYKKR